MPVLVLLVSSDKMMTYYMFNVCSIVHCGFYSLPLAHLTS